MCWIFVFCKVVDFFDYLSNLLRNTLQYQIIWGFMRLVGIPLCHVIEISIEK